MSIVATCPSCSRRLSAPAILAGKTGKCSCGATVTIPASAPPTPEPEIEVMAESLSPGKQNVFSKVVWCIALAYCVLAWLLSTALFFMCKTAIQEAAVASFGCLHVVAPYVIARGLAEISREDVK